MQICEGLLGRLKSLLASLSELSSQQAPASDSMSSSLASNTKRYNELSAVYDNCRGRVSHRAQDLQLVQDKISQSRGHLNSMIVKLDSAQLALDLDTKTTQLDTLQVLGL